jgi:hypothetical protein
MSKMGGHWKQVVIVSQGRDWLIIYCFTSRLRIFHSYGDVAITGEGLGAQGLWAGRDLYRATLLWHGVSVFPVSSKGQLHSVASYDTQGDVEGLL